MSNRGQEYRPARVGEYTWVYVCAFRIAQLLAGLQKTLLYVLLLHRGR